MAHSTHGIKHTRGSIQESLAQDTRVISRVLGKGHNGALLRRLGRWAGLPRLAAAATCHVDQWWVAKLTGAPACMVGQHRGRRELKAVRLLALPGL